MWGWIALASLAALCALLVRSGAWSAMAAMAQTYNDSYIDEADAADADGGRKDD